MSISPQANDEDFDEQALEEPVPPTMVEDDKDPEFSFANEKAYGQYHVEIDEEITGLRLKKFDPVLVKALQRGIGLHFEGRAPKGVWDKTK